MQAGLEPVEEFLGRPSGFARWSGGRPKGCWHGPRLGREATDRKGGLDDPSNARFETRMSPHPASGHPLHEPERQKAECKRQNSCSCSCSRSCSRSARFMVPMRVGSFDLEALHESSPPSLPPTVSSAAMAQVGGRETGRGGVASVQGFNVRNPGSECDLPAPFMAEGSRGAERGAGRGAGSDKEGAGL